MKKYISILSFSLLFFSCRTTVTNVGKFNEIEGDKYTYGKSKQVWLAGLIPLGRTNTATPNSGDCQVITKIRTSDFLISFLTIGIIQTETIKVIAKK